MVSDTFPPPSGPPRREEAETSGPKPLKFPSESVKKPEKRPPVSKLVFPPGNVTVGTTGPIVGNGGTGGACGGAGGAPGKALSFPDRPVMPNKVAVFDDTELLKRKMDEAVAQKLNFDNVAPVPVKTKAKPVVVNPKPMFATDDNASVVKAAVEYVQQNFPTLTCNYDRIERQIRQLSPLTLEVLMSWGGNALRENGELATEAAKNVKYFTDLNSSELMEGALKSASTVPHSKNIFQRLISSNEPTLLTFKPRLVVLNSQLVATRPTLDQLITSTGEMEKRLLLNVAALAATVAVCGQPTDDALNRTMHDRRTILTQAANQAKLVNLQLVQIRTLVAEQLTRLDQLLLVTIPAFEMANATK